MYKCLIKNFPKVCLLYLFLTISIFAHAALRTDHELQFYSSYTSNTQKINGNRPTVILCRGEISTTKMVYIEQDRHTIIIRATDSNGKRGTYESQQFEV